MPNQNPKIKAPEPKYIVLKKIKRHGRKYYPPRIHPISGCIEYDIIQLPAWEAQVWNHAGCICDMERFNKKGLLVHPDDPRN